MYTQAARHVVFPKLTSTSRSYAADIQASQTRPHFVLEVLLLMVSLLPWGSIASMHLFSHTSEALGTIDALSCIYHWSLYAGLQKKSHNTTDLDLLGLPRVSLRTVEICHGISSLSLLASAWRIIWTVPECYVL
jgi:hypothetical protein